MVGALLLYHLYKLGPTDRASPLYASYGVRSCLIGTPSQKRRANGPFFAIEWVCSVKVEHRTTRQRRQNTRNELTHGITYSVMRQHTDVSLPGGAGTTLVLTSAVVAILVSEAAQLCRDPSGRKCFVTVLYRLWRCWNLDSLAEAGVEKG